MAFPGMNTKSGANTYRQGLIVPTRASEAEFYKGYGSDGKSYAQGPGYNPKIIQPSLANPATGGYAPSGLTMEAINADPAQYANMDFSNYAPGSLGTGGDSSWFTQNKDMIGADAQGLQAAAGLANAYMGYKNYGLAKDMFGFEKAATNRNIANQAQLVNNEIQNAGEVGMSLAGNTMDPNARAQRQAQMDAMKVSGAPL